jgi:hypothetical protein
MPALDPELRSYRQHCVDAGQKAQDSYDRAILSLAGGALGVSLVFLKDVVGAKPVVSRDVLVGAWAFWTLSILFILGSFITSQRALGTAVKQIDAGKIRTEVPGRVFSFLTVVLNSAAGISFVLGVVFMLWFVNDNLG